MSQPNTSGVNIFDIDFWKTQRVIISHIPLEKLRWYGDVDQHELDKWLEQNVYATDYHVQLAKTIKNQLDVGHLCLPIHGENKIKHHFEKMLWLIWGYMEEGWRNPVKGINLLDDGEVHIHPGTHRCVVQEFVDPGAKMPVMINMHQKQLTGFEVKKELTTVEEIRNELVDNGQILVRTEHEEDLYVNGVPQRGKNKDFTYELTGSDSWPNRSLDNWSDMVFRSLPLNIYIGYDSRTPSASEVCEQSILSLIHI